MKNLVFLVALSALAMSPLRAGVSASAHGGGFGGGGYHGSSVSYGGGSSGSYRGSSGSYRGGSSGSYRGSSYFGGRYRCYGRGYGYGYGYPYGYGGYVSYPFIDDSYDDGDSYSPSDYAPPQSTSPYPASPSTTTSAMTMAPPPGPLPMGTIDPSGYIHSPYTASAFRVENLTDGQVMHDPVTGQLFVVYVNKTPATPVAPSANPTPPAQATPPTPSTPTGPIPAPTTMTLPLGKLDAFGYVHSPFSTFLFKVQNGNYAQVFRDPFTGQSFGVRVVPAAPALASDKVID